MLTKSAEVFLEHQAKRRQLPVEVLAGLAMAISQGRESRFHFDFQITALVEGATGKPFRRLTKQEALSVSPPEDFPGGPGDLSARDEWILQRSRHGMFQIPGVLARRRGYVGGFAELGSIGGWQIAVDKFEQDYQEKLQTLGLAGVIGAFDDYIPPNRCTESAFLEQVLNYAAQYQTYAAR